MSCSEDLGFFWGFLVDAELVSSSSFLILFM